MAAKRATSAGSMLDAGWFIAIPISSRAILVATPPRR
jgi:hypothetical protein